MATEPELPPPPGLRAVLHPTDLRVAGEVAFAHALRIAMDARSKLYVLHTEREAPESGVDWSAFPSIRGTLARWSLLEADAEPRAVFDRLGLNVRKVDMIDDDPVRGIVRFESEHRSDLVVLATQGRSGFQRLMGRAVAEPVARELQVPALFLPHEARGFVDAATGRVGLKRILLPVDSSPPPGQAIRYLSTLVGILGASDAALTILHVGEAGEAPVVPASTAFGSVETRAASGPVVDRIVEAAIGDDVDLVVMATRGREGFLDALRGSTTEQVLRRAGRALLAVPAGGAMARA